MTRELRQTRGLLEAGLQRVDTLLGGTPAAAGTAKKLQSLYKQLAMLMKPEEVGPWLNTEMEEFEGRSPADLIRRGETGRIWESIYFLRSRQPE